MILRTSGERTGEENYRIIMIASCDPRVVRTSVRDPAHVGENALSTTLIKFLDVAQPKVNPSGARRLEVELDSAIRFLTVNALFGVQDNEMSPLFFESSRALVLTILYAYTPSSVVLFNFNFLQSTTFYNYNYNWPTYTSREHAAPPPFFPQVGSPHFPLFSLVNAVPQRHLINLASQSSTSPSSLRLQSASISPFYFSPSALRYSTSSLFQYNLYTNTAAFLLGK
ncbi:hypothetical protein R3P38DRAFT_3353398 [Favolaschia claudopus]|uniref:Uncharacterized protein n=1 Tax=Favolaschia claudopus TaxID=2862362 RepID=A0AAW0BUK2_9AGAR